MTPHEWKEVSVGEVLQRSSENVVIEPDRIYQEVTIRLWGRGVVPRGTVSGATLAGSRRFRVQSGQFIMSRIDARHGAFGIVPDTLDGAVASNDFPSFNVDSQRLRSGFLGWLCRSERFVALCDAASEGTTNRVRLKEARFLNMRLRIPSLEEQDRILAKIEAVRQRIDGALASRTEIEIEAAALLSGAFDSLVDGADRRPMSSVAPLVRRRVEPVIGGEYPELGVRSFGKGTFHKPALDYFSIGTKKLYAIEPGDLVFSNVFAWEGAIAVAKPKDVGRFGSHRFITCVPRDRVATADFLCFYFLTEEGLEQIGRASPGGAGRNRTLGLKKLEAIEVPVPTYESQLWFTRLHGKVREMLETQTEVDTEFAAFVPSVLDRALHGQF